jgi:hypothetical protein
MRNFNFYEFVAIIIPGATFLGLLVWLIPELQTFFFGNAGLLELGYFLIFSYIGGHIIQAPASLLLKLWWKIRGGQPTDWLRKPKLKLFSEKIRSQLFEKMDVQEIKGDISKKEWHEWWGCISTLRAQVVKRSECYERAYYFLAQMNMFRGLVAVTLLAVIAEVLRWLSEDYFWNQHFGFVLLGLVLLVLFVHRMDKFGRDYAKEMVAQYLGIKEE